MFSARCTVNCTSAFQPASACDSHSSVIFSLIDSLPAHFSYLLPGAIIGLQLGEDPVSLLQHGADLVPHRRLRLRGLGICRGGEGRRERQEGGKEEERDGVGSESVM